MSTAPRPRILRESQATVVESLILNSVMAAGTTSRCRPASSRRGFNVQGCEIFLALDFHQRASERRNSGRRDAE